MSRAMVLPSVEMNEQSRFNLTLEARLEYLILAVGNAKSHPVSIGSRHETAIAFLTDLEEKLEVAKVQLEIYNVLLPHLHDGGEITERITALSHSLTNISDVSYLSSASCPSLLTNPNLALAVPAICRAL